MKNIWRIIRYSRELWLLYGLVGFLTIVLALLYLVQPLLIKQIVDKLVENAAGTTLHLSDLLWPVVWIFVADLGTTIISNISGYYGDVIASRLRKLLTLDYFNQLMRLPQKYFDDEQTGAIINRLDRGLGEITQFMNVFTNNFLQFLLSTFFTLIVIAYYSWDIALLLAVLFPIFLSLTRRTSANWQRRQRAINKIADRVRARFNEAVGQIKVVKAYVQEEREASRQAKFLERVIGITKRQSADWHYRDVGRRVVLNLIFLAVFVIIGIRGFNGSLTIGEIVLLVQYAAAIRLPLFSMSWLVDNTQRAIAGSKEFFEVLELEPAIADQPKAKNLRVKEANIRFEDVSFSYDAKTPVLQAITFTIPAGKKLALVGESGQGKTTISNLLLRLYEPTRGRIFIDGQDIKKVKQRSLRAHIGVVFQEPSLFSGTIRENIIFGKRGATEGELIEATRAANADDFIMKLPKGYDTEIGERGVKLSGGQQQRVAIARAILDDPPILVLDEATSSLDSKAEAQVQEALERLMRGRTTLIIAHRLSTIKDVDTIVTLKNGKVDEIGSPVELARTRGIYAQLLNLQKASGKQRRKLLKQYELVN